MKTAVTLFCILLSMSIFSQETITVSAKSHQQINSNTKTVQVSMDAIKSEQVQSVANQVYTHLSRKMDFSSLLDEGDTVSTVLLAISISPDKAITSVDIEGEESVRIGQLVSNAMGTMERIYLSSEKYIGPKKINIPVRLRL